MNPYDENKQVQGLVAEKDALNVYLEALLREAPPVVEAPPAPPVAKTETALSEAPIVAPANDIPPSPQPTAVDAAGRPAWGEGPFQALLFRVGGLTLSVPLVELSGVQEFEWEEITPMPGHVPWYLGLIQYRGRSVPVVDTAHLVLPEDRLAALTPPEERVRHIVFIADGTWGLACDDVAEVLTLSPEQVRWRTSRTRRRWLAGTVIEHMCALLDPPVFADVLATGIEDDQPTAE